MKKNLLIWAVILYAILYSSSLLYIGYEYGEGSLFPYPRGLEYFIYPAVYLTLLVISVFLVREREYSKRKSYYWMGTVTLAFSCLLWGSRLFLPVNGDHLDIYVYPAVLVFFSVIIFLIYLVCAARTQKESRKKSDEVWDEL